MTNEQIVQVAFYCLVVLLFPLGAMVTVELERFVVVSFLFICPLWLAVDWQLELEQLLVVTFVIPGVMLVVWRILYREIVAWEKGKMGSTPARH